MELSNLCFDFVVLENEDDLSSDGSENELEARYGSEEFRKNVELSSCPSELYGLSLVVLSGATKSFVSHQTSPSFS